MVLTTLRWLIINTVTGTIIIINATAAPTPPPGNSARHNLVEGMGRRLKVLAVNEGSARVSPQALERKNDQSQPVRSHSGHSYPPEYLPLICPIDPAASKRLSEPSIP